MEDQLYIFDPGTNVSRCPMPTIFEHLLKFTPKIEQYLSLHSQEDITNINQQLDQTLNLMVSNILSRVIAQIIGMTDKGFVTIKGTDDGALHVYLKGSDETDPLHVEIEAGANLIGSVTVTGLIHTNLRAAINIATAATHDIIAAVAGVKHKITFISFVVAGETNVTLKDETGAMSGAMDFGGTDEPRGMVAHHGISPLECTVAEKFQIISSAAVQISGYVIYHDEA